jgi:hypothetical protein
VSLRRDFLESLDSSQILALPRTLSIPVRSKKSLQNGTNRQILSIVFLWLLTIFSSNFRAVVHKI